MDPLSADSASPQGSVPSLQAQQDAAGLGTEATSQPIAKPLPEPEQTQLPTNSTLPTAAGAAPSSKADPSLPPDLAARQQLLIQADQLYQKGQREAAEALYQQAKEPFPGQSNVLPLAEPIFAPTSLPRAGQVYWRESEAGLQQKLQTRIFVPLGLLVKEYPQFVPGHLRLAEALTAAGKPEEALEVMTQAASLYPNQPEVQKGLIQQQAQGKKWLDAAITARQFTLLNPDHADALAFSQLAETYQQKFEARLRSDITNNTIGSVVTGALGIALTGNPLSGLSTLQTSILLLRGETAVGNAIAERTQRRLPMIEDAEVQAYVDRIGSKLTRLTGRPLDYQFYVINDEKLNAFALPGGKVFINGGAILKSQSEAELAGLMAHELSHAVLSHGFQLVTQSSATGGVTKFLPFVGGLLGNLAEADYSRDMEQQADLMGTRLLVSAGYAADGLRNLMVTLQQEEKGPLLPWFSSHPLSQDRIHYLEWLIIKNGYNRYAYEGIEEHQRIQELVRSQLKALKIEKDI
ncbi:MAG: M48 family metalloprotease [Acaryochloridaceae cyanobacterium CSU_5_19]|nr:M48 family metalloprotease [Acaryochloridaceae cyanobacterium CSU_5_19]